MGFRVGSGIGDIPGRRADREVFASETASCGVLFDLKKKFGFQPEGQSERKINPLTVRPGRRSVQDILLRYRNRGQTSDGRPICCQVNSAGGGGAPPSLPPVYRPKWRLHRRIPRPASRRRRVPGPWLLKESGGGRGPLFARPPAAMELNRNRGAEPIRTSPAPQWQRRCRRRCRRRGGRIHPGRGGHLSISGPSDSRGWHRRRAARYTVSACRC